MLLNDAPLGTIEQGKIADLMLLDANPFEDISNTRKIRAVVVRGQMLDRETLDTLLVRAEKLFLNTTCPTEPHKEMMVPIRNGSFVQISFSELLMRYSQKKQETAQAETSRPKRRKLIYLPTRRSDDSCNT